MTVRAPLVRSIVLPLLPQGVPQWDGRTHLILPTESGGISTPTHKNHFASQGDVTLHKLHFARMHNITKGLVVYPSIMRVHGTTNKEYPQCLSSGLDGYIPIRMNPGYLVPNSRFGKMHTNKNESKASCPNNMWRGIRRVAWHVISMRSTMNSSSTTPLCQVAHLK